MENIILSLLLIKSMTIYEMKIFTEKFLFGACSSSLGSMQIALKKLIDKQYIAYEECEENGRKKKIYRITEKGVQEFLSWMKIPFNWNKGKNMEESKLFFLGMLPKNLRIEKIQQLIQDTEEQKSVLLEIQMFIEMTKGTMVETNVNRMLEDEELVRNVLLVSGEQTLEAAVQSIGDYQCYMLEYGLKKIETDLEFFKTIYERETNSEE